MLVEVMAPYLRSVSSLIYSNEPSFTIPSLTQIQNMTVLTKRIKIVRDRHEKFGQKTNLNISQ